VDRVDPAPDRAGAGGQPPAHRGRAVGKRWKSGGSAGAPIRTRTAAPVLDPRSYPQAREVFHEIPTFIHKSSVNKNLAESLMACAVRGSAPVLPEWLVGLVDSGCRLAC